MGPVVFDFCCWWFCLFWNLSDRAFRSLLGILSSCSRECRCQVLRWPQDGSLTLHPDMRNLASLNPSRVVFLYPASVLPKAISGKDYLLKRPPRHKRTVGLTIRQHKKGKKENIISQHHMLTQNSLQSKLYQFYVCPFAVWSRIRIAKHPGERWIHIPLSLCDTHSQILMSENKIHKLHYLSAFSFKQERFNT